MRYKILFLIESLSGGGAEKVLTVLLKYLDYEKYEVTLCPIVDTGIYCEEVQKYISNYKPIVTYRGNKVHRCLNRIKYKLIYSVMPLSWVYKLFIPKGCDVEVAFCEGYVTKLLAHSCSRTKKIAWVHIDLKYFPWTIDKGIFKDVNEERSAYATMDRIVCVSKTVEKSFQERYGLKERSCAIYNPIDIEDIKKKAGQKVLNNDGVFRIISIGRLVPQKGYDRLLRVVKQLHEENYSLNLLILGEGQEHKILDTYIRENRMQDYVCLPGFTSNPYKDLQNADLFVCSSRVEGFSLVVAEAMVLEVPVLSTYCSGPNELLEEGKNGLWIENSEKALYEGIKHILDCKSLLKNYIIPARCRIMDFDPQNIICEIEKTVL